MIIANRVVISRPDPCKCGHDRAIHRPLGGGCIKCEQSKPGQGFTCEPGVCDRFTWDARKYTTQEGE